MHLLGTTSTLALMSASGSHVCNRCVCTEICCLSPCGEVFPMRRAEGKLEDEAEVVQHQGFLATLRFFWGLVSKYLQHLEIPVMLFYHIVQ